MEEEAAVAPARIDFSGSKSQLHDNKLIGVNKKDFLDLAIFFSIVVFGGVSLLSVIARWPWWVSFTNIVILSVIGFYATYQRMVMRPDHLRAQQSDRILSIAREAISYFREGLNFETADAVCEIILQNTHAPISVAITNNDTVLGFAGVGSDHHRVGEPIVTSSTRHAIIHDEAQILSSKDEIGCPEVSCKIVAAIIVPLKSGENVVGTLKFYYDDERHLNETELALAEGLASLLSTQLELHELTEQAALTTEMELKALQAQINPHFLFNTLNTISAYIRTDPMLARALLKRFASFYRYSLEHAGDRVPLGLELDFVEQYFALEQARFGDRLTLNIDVSEEMEGMLLPPFMLQPLVENAVGHGMRDDGSPLTILIKAFVGNSHIEIYVEDDGVGMDEEKLSHVFDHSEGKGLGIALRNVRDRTAGVFGPASSFVIESEEGKGTKARFIIPSVCLIDPTCGGQVQPNNGDLG